MHTQYKVLFCAVEVGLCATTQWLYDMLAYMKNLFILCYTTFAPVHTAVFAPLVFVFFDALDLKTEELY